MPDEKCDGRFVILDLLAVTVAQSGKAARAHPQAQVCSLHVARADQIVRYESEYPVLRYLYDRRRRVTARNRKRRLTRIVLDDLPIMARVAERGADGRFVAGEGIRSDEGRSEHACAQVLQKGECVLARPLCSRDS